MAKPIIVIALACILAPSIGHAQESDTLLDDPRVLREGNETSKMLFLLPQQERHETMTRFISANGQPCAAVTRTMYQGSAAPDGVDFWSIDCGNASYMAWFTPDNKDQFIDCRFMALIGPGSGCWIKFEK
ncbi:MAG TPA: hypothetical protein VF938_09390 [Candidatus Angelobacter sp.]